MLKLEKTIQTRLGHTFFSQLELEEELNAIKKEFSKLKLQVEIGKIVLSIWDKNNKRYVYPIINYDNLYFVEV